MGPVSALKGILLKCMQDSTLSPSRRSDKRWCSEPCTTGLNQVCVCELPKSAAMTRMAMQMNLRMPVANLAGSHGKVAQAVPRSHRVSSARQSAFFGGSLRQLTALQSQAAYSRKTSALIVEAAKKSVGDLSKGDLEGKVVLVGIWPNTHP